ncbi:MAG: HAMP domain-containing sensor histidine kinase [bacterium]
MKPKLIIILMLLVLVPLGLITWLGVKTARQEQERVQQRMRQVLIARLAELRESVRRLVEKEGRDFQRLADLATERADAEAIRDLVRGNRLVRQMFVVAPDRQFIFPPREGASERERESLLRLAPIWKSGAAVHPAGPEAGTMGGDSGWHTWFAEEGLQFYFWRRLSDGRSVGIELESAALLADVIALLPSSDVPGAGLPAGHIVLQDARNVPLYQWGDYRPAAQEVPLARLPLVAPLNAWSLEYFAPEAEFGRAVSGSARFNIGAAVGAVAVVLFALALYFYRESSREIRAAAQKVSFVNQVSHELKTPLTNIRLYAELLEDSIPENDAKTRGYLDIVTAESRRLSRLINNILTFARQQKARPVLHLASGLVDDTIAATLESFRPALEEAGVRIVFNPNAGRRVKLDADAVEQILGNLVSNVEKYAVGGKWLEVTSLQEGDRTLIRVADRGPGIPAGKTDDIFRPFVRLSDRLTEGVSGTGLGLSIARDLARLHGGDVSLESSVEGACFLVVLQTPGEV